MLSFCGTLACNACGYGDVGRACACEIAGKDRAMDRRLWKVTLRADGGTYRHLIVSAGDKNEAMESACNIELAPLCSVVKVVAYSEAN